MARANRHYIPGQVSSSSRGLAPQVPVPFEVKPMPRCARLMDDDGVYHVLNRGNGQQRIESEVL